MYVCFFLSLSLSHSLLSPSLPLSLSPFFSFSHFQPIKKIKKKTQLKCLLTLLLEIIALGCTDSRVRWEVKKHTQAGFLMLLITHQDMDKTTFVSNELAHLKFLCFHFRKWKKEERKSKDERTKEAAHRKTESFASIFF